MATDTFPRAIPAIEFEQLRTLALDIGPYTVPQDKSDLFTVSYKTLASIQLLFREFPDDYKAEDKLLLYEDRKAHESVSQTLESLCRAHVLWQRIGDDQKARAQYTFDVLMRLFRHKVEVWIKSVYTQTKAKCPHTVDEALQLLEKQRAGQS